MTPAPTTSDVNNALAVRGVTVKYGAVSALKDLSLDVAPNEVVGVIGPNGSGKTTLLNCISGFMRPVSGQISVYGERVERLRPYQRSRRGVGRTFQHARLVSDLSARGNVLSAAQWMTTPSSLIGEWLRLPSWRTRIRNQMSDIEDVLDRCEISADRSEPVEGMPFGQRKLVDLARALSGRPNLLLMDEPTAGLSDPEVRTLAQMLRTRTDSISMLIVAHHMGFVAEVATRVICLEEGSLIANGTPAEVQADPQVITAYVGAS